MGIEGAAQATVESSGMLGADLGQNLGRISADFGYSADLVVKRASCAPAPDFACVYLKEMADERAVSAVSEEMSRLFSEGERRKPGEFLGDLERRLGAVRESRLGADLGSLCKDVLDGSIVFLIDGCAQFLSVGAFSDKGRSVTEPTSQTIVKGPKDAFTEDADKNIFLIRRRLRNISLRVEEIIAGSVTQTRLKMLYLSGVARDEIVSCVRERLQRIEYDGILDSGYIEEMIKEDRYTIFPTVLNSEKPDAIVAALLEGRVAIIVDGSPYVLSVPALFVDFVQVSEDYYHNYVISSLVRVVRYAALLLTLLVPAMFVALTNYHQEIIPTPLLISIAAQHEGVPFPAFVEVLLMEITFEILREAGIRMPRAIGPAISIVGALVLGEATVRAGLISAAVVIVVSLTAISSFAVTNYAMSNAIRILRFILLFLGGIYGLYGISIGMVIAVVHLCKLKSVSVPYMSPLAPALAGGRSDAMLRLPLLKTTNHPVGLFKTAKPDIGGRSPVAPEEKGKPEHIQAP